MKKLFPLTFALLLAACAGTLTRIDTPIVRSELSLTAAVGSAVVQTVSLPAYAAAEELSIETAPGVITSGGDLLWADLPERAVTLKIAAHLDQILSANVSPDPWPFPGLPDVGIDIRVSDMLARANGNFSLRGIYYVGGDGIDFRNSSHAFDIAIPLTDMNPATVANAQALAILQLSESIARQLAR